MPYMYICAKFTKFDTTNGQTLLVSKVTDLDRQLRVNAPNKKETFMSNLLSTKIIVVSILVPVYSHEHRVNHYTYSTCITWYNHTIRYILQTNNST